ncbi:NIPSNAP family protein [Actinokineospora globicatena]|uniref:NIPSNAP family protein n=1 Tax=Actinokineospora globicatena TaxID=103729 RepID=UPI0020A52799|nr:NIPSNAP family protein [Actinokineospora globicatena]MCP2306695.1 NIPSNAP protein [Actinokineospora globicatena]
MATPGIVELRQYTLHPGRRDELVELFEREFVDSQAAVGMPVLGTFRQPSAPDRFVWLRAFPDLAGRGPSLTEFYTGPVWAAHSAAANATMVDFRDVLLLRPVQGDFPAPREQAGPVRISVHHFDGPADDLAGDSPDRLVLATHPGPNEFPALPVREGEHVLVTVSLDTAIPPVPASWARRAVRGPEHLLLEPTATSLLR